MYMQAAAAIDRARVPASLAHLGDEQLAELGFSLNPFKAISNVAKAVTKGVKDIAAEAGRAAKNPLVQGVASFVPGGGLITKGIGIASSIGGSRVAQVASNVEQLTSGRPLAPAPTAAQPVAVLRRKVGTGQPGADVQAKQKRDAKAAQGAAIQAANKAAADAAAAAAETARAAKVAEGAAIQERNRIEAEAKAAAEKAAKVTRRKTASLEAKLKEATANAATLAKQADDAAKSGDAAKAAQLRAESEAATAAARTMSSSSGGSSSFAPQYPAGGSPVAVVPAPEAPAGMSTSTKALIAAGVAAAGLGVLAVAHGGGGSREWR